ncbi:FlgD immunoglobulin-like domain containing protein, partial [Candidatus Eisenbacteria bacterium]
FGSQFIDNTASGDGGGVSFLDGVDAEVESTTFDGNTGRYAGGALVSESSARFVSCTFHGETLTRPEGGSLNCNSAAVELENTIIAFSVMGSGMVCSGDCTPVLTCCDIYGNEGGDWVSCIADQLGANGNISQDPLFCSDALPEGPLHIQVDSPCAPHTPPNPECGLIGAWPANCDSLGSLFHACCFGDSCQLLTVVECNDLGGASIYGFLSCDPNPCLEFAACCVADSCQLLTPTQCSNASGEWMAGFETCEPNPCVPNMACCSDEVCQILPEDDCIAAGGVWQPDIASCDPNPCIPPVFACCIEEECQISREDDCLLAGGEWHPGVESCTPNPCWYQYACCMWDGCQILTLAGCNASGGVWQDGVAACDPDPCVGLLRACCLDDDCSLQSGADCTASGGVWLTHTETCSPSPCVGVYLVTPAGNGDFPTIQVAIDAVEEGAIVALVDGTFSGDGNRDITYRGKAVTVRSHSGHPQSCIIECDGGPGSASRGFDFAAGESLESILEGVSIIGGFEQFGGGIRCSTSSPTIADCIISNCEALDHGGGIYCTESSPEITGCEFTENNASRGAGVSIVGGAPTVTSCQLNGNTATSNGGGAYFSTGTIACLQSTTFAGNHASSKGGAAVVNGASPEFEGCTFFENEAGADGGSAIWCLNEGNTAVRNSIIAFGVSGYPPVYCPDHIPSFTCCDIYGNEGGDWVHHIAGQLGINGNISEDPLFCRETLPEGPLQIQADSPCAPFTPPNPECGLIGAWAANCDSLGLISYACCLGDLCYLVTESQCLDAGGDWHAGTSACSPNPCVNACCIADSCLVTIEDACLSAGGAWLMDVKSCDPMPCARVCCDGEVCHIMNVVACADSGWVWLADVESCDADPCLEYVCCLDSECQILKQTECQAAGGDWLEGVESCTPNPCSLRDLSDGVFMVHAIPEVQWSFGEEYCQRYLDEYAISASHEQVNRIDPDTLVNESSIWYVLAAWDQPKEFCSVQFGMGEFNEQMFWFQGWGPCNDGGLEVASADWPGPHEGVLVLHNDRWLGNYVPVYHFGGEARFGGEIPLTIDETIGLGGFTNCEALADHFDATCYGTLGILTEGTPCYHGGDLYACCFDTVCAVTSQSACYDLAGEWHPEWMTCDPNWCLLMGSDDLAPSGGSRLFRSRPNPVSELALLSYQLEHAEHVQLVVYDATGRVVRTLVDADQPAGQHTVAWKGIDDTGAPAPAGVYFYRMRWNGRSQTMRLLLLR